MSILKGRCWAGTGEPVEAPTTYTGTAMAYAGKAIDLTTHVLDTAKCATHRGAVVNIMCFLCRGCALTTSGSTVCSCTGF